MARALLGAHLTPSPHPLECPAEEETDNRQSSTTPGLLCTSARGPVYTEWIHCNITVALFAPKEEVL